MAILDYILTKLEFIRDIGAKLGDLKLANTVETLKKPIFTTLAEKKSIAKHSASNWNETEQKLVSFLCDRKLTFLRCCRTSSQNRKVEIDRNDEQCSIFNFCWREKRVEELRQCKKQSDKFEFPCFSCLKVKMLKGYVQAKNLEIW